MSDPTAINLASEGDYTDPLVRRITGWTSHGNHRLDMPFITEVADNLWHGGCENGLVLPSFIRHVVSLYKWESYRSRHELLTQTVVEMFDAEDQGFEQIDALAAWVNLCRQSGPVLVHCQAGVNRSSLVVAKALILSGEVESGAEAVEKMREARSPGVLCNPAFERWVRAHEATVAA